MDYLARKHGAAAQASIVVKTSGSILPPSLNFNLIGKRALGSAFTDEYDAWLAQLKQTYARVRDSLDAAGLTPSERITTTGRYAQYARISADGRMLAYADENGKESSHTRVLDLASGGEAWSTLRNGIGPAAWLPDGSLLTAQLEFGDRYALLSDLYRFRADGATRPGLQPARAARCQRWQPAAAGRKQLWHRLVAAALEPGRQSHCCSTLEPGGCL
jgi:hypothetical protein